MLYLKIISSFDGNDAGELRVIEDGVKSTFRFVQLEQCSLSPQ